MGKLSFVTQHRVDEGFFKDVELGEIFEYSMNDFMYQDIEREAEKFGVHLEYCHPGSEEYNRFGCFICRVVGFENGKRGEERPLPIFDPEELML